MFVHAKETVQTETRGGANAIQNRNNVSLLVQTEISLDMRRREILLDYPGNYDQTLIPCATKLKCPKNTCHSLSTLSTRSVEHAVESSISTLVFRNQRNHNKQIVVGSLCIIWATLCRERTLHNPWLAKLRSRETLRKQHDTKLHVWELDDKIFISKELVPRENRLHPYSRNESASCLSKNMSIPSSKMVQLFN